MWRGAPEYSSRRRRSGALPRCVVSCRQLNRKAGPLAQRAVQENLALMHLHDFFGDGQAQAGGARLCSIHFQLSETFKEPLLNLGGDPRPRIAHPQQFI